MPTGARLLYIDDDAGLRRLVSRALNRREMDVTTAAGGEEGVALAAAQHFDVIAVDHYMPGMDGLEDDGPAPRAARRRCRSSTSPDRTKAASPSPH